MKLPPSPFEQPKRMAIMVLLERHYCIIFSELYTILQLSRGSVDSHLRKLEEFNYITREVKFVNTSSQVMVCPTQEGLKAFQEAKQIWRNLIDGNNL